VLINFEQRWRRQAKTQLRNFTTLLISIKEEEIQDDEAWNARICRSIDPFSADIPRKENSIQYAYVNAIRRARKFIYIENQVSFNNNNLQIIYIYVFIYYYFLVFYGKC
jgi:phosphatidylserine/phosphatidylglycerophosphate/cardiolipin synthase-like enzyme